MKRRAIGWATMVLVCIIFIVGIVWIVLYYGMITPIQTAIGTSWADSNTLTFMETMAAWWVFVCLIAAVIWYLNQSNKQGLTY